MCTTLNVQIQIFPSYLGMEKGVSYVIHLYNIFCYYSNNSDDISLVLKWTSPIFDVNFMFYAYCLVYCTQNCTIFEKIAYTLYTLIFCRAFLHRRKPYSFCYFFPFFLLLFDCTPFSWFSSSESTSVMMI